MAFGGSPVDVADGYIHFSSAAQLRETVKRHFQGQADLVLLSVDSATLGPDLRWEPSRGGDLFPHLYAALPVKSVIKVDELPLDAQGVHQFPVEVP
jgi:uncharacterized protein (DUF952 family)